MYGGGNPNPYGAYGGAPPPNAYPNPCWAPPPNAYGAPPNVYGGMMQGMHQGMQPPPIGYGSQPMDPTLALFQSVDRDGSGSISGNELQQALRQGGMEFNLDTAHRMVNMFDKSGDGKIGYPEFQQLNQWVTQMHQAFRQVDTSRNGLLDGQETRRALAASNYHLEEQTFQTMMRKMDKERRGQLSLSAYMDMCMFLGHARNVYAFYDKARTNQVVFSFDAFLVASLSMRL